MIAIKFKDHVGTIDDEEIAKQLFKRCFQRQFISHVLDRSATQFEDIASKYGIGGSINPRRIESCSTADIHGHLLQTIILPTCAKYSEYKNSLHFIVSTGNTAWVDVLEFYLQSASLRFIEEDGSKLLDFSGILTIKEAARDPDNLEFFRRMLENTTVQEYLNLVGKSFDNMDEKERVLCASCIAHISLLETRGFFAQSEQKESPSQLRNYMMMKLWMAYLFNGLVKGIWGSATDAIRSKPTALDLEA